MVRETRHLWVGNLPDNIREERIREHFKRYGRVQSVKLLPGSNGSLCAAVAFMDIKSASKAHNCEHTLDEHALSTEYYEPGPYTSSQQRFPIGIADDHSSFERTSHFYERGSSTPGTPLTCTGTRSEVDGYLRRSSVYHTPPDPLRGRPRDRPYRNGPPYPPGTERSSCSNNRRNWVYDTGAVRYLSSSEEHGTGKSKKVRSGSESRSGSQSSRSRSPTRSTTGSPRSSDSSTRSDSPRSTRVSVQSTVAPPVQQTSSSTLAVYSEDRRPLAICVRNLPTRSSDTSLKDGLFHEYKKHGKVTWVKVVGAANERYALVCFKKPEDVEKAIEVSQDKLFFGCKIDVAPYHGYDVEDNEARPYDTELDEYHPKATRTLFIGNLEKDVTAGDIRQHFDQFGEIIEIDIKKQPGVTSSYAFCQYADIGSVVQAMRTLDGEPLGESRLKLGFGKSMASSCVWIAGVAEQVSDKYLDLQFRKFGPVSHVVVDRERGQALIFYEQVSAAAAAVKEMRGVPLRGNRIQIDFASRECQEAFYERIDVQGRDNTWSSFESTRSERDILCSRYESSRFRYDSGRVRSSSYSRSSGGRTPRRHEVYESPRYKSYEELSPSSDHEDYPNETPDLRHLHKERNHLQHLLDQLDRPLRSVTAADQGLVVTTHNHRRRLSSHQRLSGEGPAPLCKRRKTGSTSEDERRKHHHHHSGDESRPGTPLFDEKPDNVQPQEPRRVPREKPEEPLSLPLPQFAAQCFSNAKTTSTPTSLAHSTSVQQAPPASPVRPPSPSSTTSSSDISPQSPTLEERIRSLDEKYEKWTGRTLQPPTKPKHRLLDVDVRELQPSDIVKSVLAKPSVFDDDSKRLENFGEKYEPRDFSSYPRSVGLEVQRFVPGDPRNPSYISNLSVKVSPLNSPSGVVLSPCPAAKGLQYPFPSHPPVQPTTSVATTTAGSSPPPSAVVRPVSKSVEFSVQKAESWLGISKNTDNSQKDFLVSSGGFAQRLNVHSKVSETGMQRHNVMKLTELVTQKIDIPVQKSMDPRLEKTNSQTTVTTMYVLSQRMAIKCNDIENNKNDTISQKNSNLGSSINIGSNNNNINNNNNNNSNIHNNNNNNMNNNNNNNNNSNNSNNSNNLNNNNNNNSSSNNNNNNNSSNNDSNNNNNNNNSNNMNNNNNNNNNNSNSNSNNNNNNMNNDDNNNNNNNSSSNNNNNNNNNHNNNNNDNNNNNNDDDNNSSSNSNNNNNNNNNHHYNNNNNDNDNNNNDNNNNNNDSNNNDHSNNNTNNNMNISNMNNNNNTAINPNINNKISTNSGSFSSSYSINNHVSNLSASNTNNSNNSNYNNDESNCNKNSSGISNSIDKNGYFNGDVRSKEENVSECEIAKHGKDEESKSSKSDSDSVRTSRLNSVNKAEEVLIKNVDNLASVKPLKSEPTSTLSEPIFNEEDADEIVVVNSLGSSVINSVETQIKHKNKIVDSEKFSIFSSDKQSVENKKFIDDNNINQNIESTNKLESSSFRSNVSHSKTPNVILAESEGLIRSLSNQGLAKDTVKSNAGSGSWTKTNDTTVSKISENSVKLLHENNKFISNKSVSVVKDEFVPFSVRDKESGVETSEKIKLPMKGREKCGKEIEKDKNRDKDTVEKERDKEKSLLREKQRDREIPENVDKERKKDREVETERKKDRESMEVIEREKKKENDIEKDKKKDQSDVLDRRKEGSDKKLLESERTKKKEDEKEKKKEKESEKKKDSHSSDRYKKSSDEKKREIESEARKKDKIGNQPATIGSKRRISSQDSVEGAEDSKRIKTDYKRRDSKESRNSLSSSSSNNKIIKVEQKLQETKPSNDSKHKLSLEAQKSFESKIQDYKRKDDSERKKSQVENLDRKKDTKKIQIKLEDILKNSNDCSSKNSRENEKSAVESVDDKRHGHKRESKEKKKSLKQEFGSTESLEDKKVQRKEKKSSGEKKKEEEILEGKRGKERTRSESKKENGHETETDSDSEPKKHSIFDVVLDEPAYISMYDKVKARSCKNMQKQEEEKKQVKLKEKFSQLKQSRAKREEKKISASWDEDSDSDASQIRRIPRRSFSRLSSEDEGVYKREKKSSESWDNENRRSKKSYDTSEDEGIKVKTILHASDVYSDESDAENVDKISRKTTSKNKSKSVFESSEEESGKRSILKENFHSAPKPEKIGMDCKNKVRLSLDSSTDRFCHENKNKKRTVTESMSEGEPSYHSSAKSMEKIEKKKAKKKEKRQKSIEDDPKNMENDFVFNDKGESEKSAKTDKERRKSVHSSNEDHEEVVKSKKNKSSKNNLQYNVLPKKEESKYDDIFDDYSDDSNDNQLKSKAEVSNHKGTSSKWQVAQIYGTDSDSNADAAEHVSVGKQRKSKDKKKREKKVREPSEELLEAGRALEKLLSSPPSRRESEELIKHCDSAEDFSEEKVKNKEKKKKRKRSKDEKSRHHHHHHHHSFSEKSEPSVSTDSVPRSGVLSPVTVARISPPLPSLVDMPTSPSVKKEPASPMSPKMTQTSKNSEKTIPGFGYEIDEKIHESAIQSIAMLDIPKTELKVESKELLEETPDRKEETKERTVISQEETEDAVAALLGETFTYNSCFEGNSPVEPEPEPHDEEEMRQAVQSLNECKPDTPQSESGLQIDTDAEEQDEQFSGLRFDSLPRTPDLDLSQPPKTPDIQPQFVIESKPISFVRKDTTRNSRDDMEIRIVSPTSPDPLISYQNVKTDSKDKGADMDLKPPVLKPASPKHFKDEPPTIEPISSISGGERIFVDNRLLLHPPPLVPVAKPISVATPKSSPGLSIVRPIISLSANTTPTLVLTPIRTANPLVVSSAASSLPRKTFTISTTTSSIITTRTSIPPPILSPVTPSLTSPVRLSPPCTDATVGSVSPRFTTTSATVVSSQHLPAHLISQKIILHQVAKTTPTRLVSAPASVVKVVDSATVQKSSSNEMPALTLPEPVNNNPATVRTIATPPPSLGPAVSQSTTSLTTAILDISRSEMSQTTSVISVIPRSMPVTSHSYTHIATSASIVESNSTPQYTASSASSSSNPSVISVHTNLVESKNIPSNSQNVIQQNFLPSAKILSFTNVPEKLVPETNVIEPDKIALRSPKQTSVIEPLKTEEKPLDLQINEVDLRGSERERIEEEKKNFKEKTVEQSGETVDLKVKEKDGGDDHALQQSAGKPETLYNKNAPIEILEHSESVIKKVDSLSSLKSEESTNENVEFCDKSDTSSINQDECMRLLSSEEENKQVNSVVTRKGRKKANRSVGIRRAKHGSVSKNEAFAGKRGGKTQRVGKAQNDLGKKQSKDVYEFHDESDEDGSGEKERPRLILTIKSPNSVKDQTAVANKTAVSSSKSPKDGGLPVKSPEQKAVVFEKDICGVNTRKSRRLLEKDGFRNTIDDVIEDVVRNGGNKKSTSPRRSLRQVAKPAPVLPVPKKISTRTAKKSIGCASTDDEMKEGEASAIAKTSESAFVEEKEVTPTAKTVPANKEHHEAEGETSDEEPTTLIDPVTGMLMVMRAKEEGKYVPVPNVPPIAPPTPPPPPTKADVLPIVPEGLASHWLNHETLKQAVIKVQTYGEHNKMNPVFLNRPPTPPTTPQARIQETMTRLPVEMMKKVSAEQVLELETPKSEHVLLQPMELSKQKICHIEQGKLYSEINRVDYGDASRNAVPESGKVLRQLSKTQPPPTVNKVLCAKGVAILASPNKQLYQNPKHIKMSPQNQILTGAVASSPPRVVKTTPPTHELHPLTGAVASPPPRAPHLTSQQPVVTGASSSRALVDAPKGPGGSPRGMTIPPYEATLQTPTQNLHSPPPAHQQGEGINMGHLGHPPFVHPQLMYQQYLRAQEILPSPYQLTASLQGKLEERERERGAGDMGRSPPLELRTSRATDSPTVYMGRQQYTRYYDDPPPAHLHAGRQIHQAPDAPGQPRLQIATPPHASQVPPQADSLLMLLQRYPIMWQGLLALKNDQSAVQMHFVFGNPHVARDSLPCNSDGSTPPLRIAQRMRLEQTQLEGVARKMQMDNEHCMLLALPCGRDHMDVLQQSTNLQTGFITYLQQKQAAGIVNIAHPGSQQAAYVVHIFPSCEFANENLARNAPDLLHRMQEIPHLVIVIATV